MYPDLSYILHDLFNTPADNFTSIIKTFGLFLVIAFIVSHYFLKKELKRKTALGLITPSKESMMIGKPPTMTSLLINVLIGFFLGFKLIHLLGAYRDIGTDLVPFLVSMEGNWIGGIIGGALFGAGYWIPVNRQKLDPPQKKSITVQPHQRTTDIAVRAGISGIIGAKLFAMFESVENIKAFFADPIGQFFSGSGLAIYGGLIVAFIYVYWYVNRKGIKPIHMMDAVAPALMIGYAVGRIGCQLSGDGDWGIVATADKPGWFFFPDWMWSYTYPRNVLQQGVPMENCNFIHCQELSQGVYPTPLYEIIVCLILFAILWGLRKRLRAPGLLFFIYLLMNGVERFWIEKIRVNDKIDMLGMQLTQAEIISSLLIVVSIIGVVWSIQSNRKSSTK